MQSETEGFVNRPHLAEKIHCVVFVLSAAQLEAYPASLGSTLQQLREHISDMGTNDWATFGAIRSTILTFTSLAGIAVPSRRFLLFEQMLTAVPCSVCQASIRWLC